MKPVRSRYEQRRRKTCSRHCQGVVFGHVRHLTPAQRLAAAERSKVSRRAAAMRSLAGLRPIEIFRKGFSVGWKAGVRSAARRLAVTA